MPDLDLLNTAVAAAASVGVLGCLAVTIILGLICRGLYRKSRRLQRELDAAKESKQALLTTLQQSYRDKALLTFYNASLRGRVRELLSQRRALGFALVFADDEIDRLDTELRSANRRLHAADLRSCRQAGDLHETREALRSAERRLRWAQEDNRLLRGLWLASSCPPVVVYPAGGHATLSAFVHSTAVIEFNDGTTKTLSRPDAPASATFIVHSRPAPTLLHATTVPGRVSFSWQRNARNNSHVEVRVNRGQWIELDSNMTNFAFDVPDNSKVTFEVRNVWSTGQRYSVVSSMQVLTTRSA